MSELTPEMAERYNLGNANGIIVVGVQAGGKADKAGIEEGDLILEVNHGSVDSVTQFKKLLDQNKKGAGIKLLVKRMNAGLFGDTLGLIFRRRYRPDRGGMLTPSRPGSTKVREKISSQFWTLRRPARKARKHRDIWIFPSFRNVGK